MGFNSPYSVSGIHALKPVSVGGPGGIAYFLGQAITTDE